MNCSICFKEKPIIKKMRGTGGIVLNYCRECYDGVYSRIAPTVLERIEQARKEGKKITFQDTLQLVKKLTAEKQGSILNESKN